MNVHMVFLASLGAQKLCRIELHRPLCEQKSANLCEILLTCGDFVNKRCEYC